LRKTVLGSDAKIYYVKLPLAIAEALEKRAHADYESESNYIRRAIIDKTYPRPGMTHRDADGSQTLMGVPDPLRLAGSQEHGARLRLAPYVQASPLATGRVFPSPDAAEH